MSSTLARTEIIHYGDAEIVVRCTTLATELDKTDMRARLKDQLPRGSEYVELYLDVVTQTLRTQGLGFDLPSASVDVETHAAAFAQLADLPLDLLTQWSGAIARVNAPPGTKSELQPHEVISKDPK